MYFSRIALVLFATCALASEVSVVYTEATSFGAMLARGEAIAKRQGYTPVQQPCGTGRTCQEACGAGAVQCPSTDLKVHCHFPATGTHCCTDGAGKACKAGYYCTTDGLGKTYCCPDGILEIECARLYSITVPLMRETSRIALPSVSVPLSSVPALTPVVSTGSSRIRVPSTGLSVPTFVGVPSGLDPPSSVRPSGPTSISPVLPSSKANATSTSTQLPNFTSGATKIAGAGMAVLAGATGFLLMGPLSRAGLI